MRRRAAATSRAPRTPPPYSSCPPEPIISAAQSGAAEVRDRIAVGSGTTVKHLLTFNAVKLSVAVQVDGTDSGHQPITVRVLTPEQRTEEVARSTAEAPVFLLPPRRYRVEAQLGTENVKAATEIDLPAGRDTKISFKLPSAELTVMPRAGQPGLRSPLAGKGRKGRDRTPLRRGRAADGPSCSRTLCRANTG